MWRVRLALICFSVTLILFGTVLGFQMAGGKLAPATVSSATDPYAAGLVANRTGDNVALTWDKTSPVVKAAARARLTVSEGALQRTVDLDQSQVLAGSVLYRHIAPEIDFRMELILKDQRSVVESTTFKQ